MSVPIKQPTGVDDRHADNLAVRAVAHAVSLGRECCVGRLAGVAAREIEHTGVRVVVGAVKGNGWNSAPPPDRAQRLPQLRDRLQVSARPGVPSFLPPALTAPSRPFLLAAGALVASPARSYVKPPVLAGALGLFSPRASVTPGSGTLTPTQAGAPPARPPTGLSCGQDDPGDPTARAGPPRHRERRRYGFASPAPLAVSSTPPKMEDTVPVALFLLPPWTDAPPPLAVFTSPPLTAEASPEA
jgi:hypothetical protein